MIIIYVTCRWRWSSACCSGCTAVGNHLQCNHLQPTIKISPSSSNWPLSQTHQRSCHKNISWIFSYSFDRFGLQPSPGQQQCQNINIIHILQLHQIWQKNWIPHFKCQSIQDWQQKFITFITANTCWSQSDYKFYKCEVLELSLTIKDKRSESFNVKCYISWYIILGTLCEMFQKMPLTPYTFDMCKDSAKTVFSPRPFPLPLAFFTTLSIRDVKANYQKAKSPKLSKSQKIPKVSKSVKSPKKLKSMMLQLERNYWSFTQYWGNSQTDNTLRKMVLLKHIFGYFRC